MTGVLYVVATPIGNLADMSSRAIEVLGKVDLIAAEDTRHSARLLQHYHISTTCVSYHDHNECRVVERLVGTLEAGQTIALISDAGTPLISDPGYRLTRAAHEHGIPVIPIAGPCALVAALSSAGLPTDRFCFEGFLPPRGNARRTRLRQLAEEQRTLVLYVSPHHIVECLNELCEELGEQRRACLAREISKRFETIRTAPLAGLRDWVANDPNQQRGEFVICIEGRSEAVSASDREAERVLRILLDEVSRKQAIALAGRITGRRRNELYPIAMRLSGDAREA